MPKPGSFKLNGFDDPIHYEAIDEAIDDTITELGAFGSSGPRPGAHFNEQYTQLSPRKGSYIDV